MVVLPQVSQEIEDAENNLLVAIFKKQKLSLLFEKMCVVGTFRKLCV